MPGASNMEDVAGFIDVNQDNTVDEKDSISGMLIPNLYYSFLIKVNDTARLLANSNTTGDYFQAIMPSNSSTTFVARLSIRKAASGNNFQIGLRINSNGTSATAWATGIGESMTLGTTYLLAFRYTFNAGTNDDKAEMWINPPLDGNIPTADVSVTNASTTADISKLGAILLRQGANTPAVDMDAIAAGASWHDVVLPINVQSFQAALHNHEAQLNWTLSFDQNMKGFNVERSMDGSNFETIGFVAANNNSANQNYVFADANLKSGINYYRLKILNKDGSFKYSSVVVIVNQPFGTTTLFPNPVQQNLTISHERAGKYGTLRVLDMSGKQVMMVKAQQGATQTAINLPVIAAGTYMLVYENDGQKTISKFVKE